MDLEGRTTVVKQPICSALLRFERGVTILRLRQRHTGYRWFEGRRPFGKAFPSVETAVRFLKDLSKLYNLSLDLRRLKEGREGARKGK